MAMSGDREKVRFGSGDAECAAWHYPGTNGACVVMAGGFAVTKEPGTDLFARRFCDAGFAVLAFDYRRLGESGGSRARSCASAEQLADWQAAIGFAATLPGVDPARLAIWGFSVSGGHVFRIAARSPRLAAAIAQTPNADGPAAARNAARHQRPLAMLRLAGWRRPRRARRPGRPPPRLVPLAGEPGTVALAHDTGRPGRGPSAQPGQQVSRTGSRRSPPARRSALAFYRPGRDAALVRCPLLVLVCDQDQTALAGPAAALPSERPAAELVRLPGGTTRRSWTVTSRPSRPSCPSCAGTCSIRSGRPPRCRASVPQPGGRA